MKYKVSQLEKGKQQEEREEDYVSFKNTNVEIFEGKRDNVTGFSDMRILTIQYQHHHVMLNICIEGKMFSLRTLIYSGADINVLHSKIIPSEYWIKAFRKVVGLGDKELQYEVPKATICFEEHYIKLKFVVADIPIHYILSNVFLAADEPHRSTRLSDNRAGYLITVPKQDGSCKKIKLPYISTPRISTMVQAMKQLEMANKKLDELKYLKATMIVGEQLLSPGIKKQISDLKQRFESEFCAEEPNYFWHKKQNFVELPYKSDYEGRPCKSKAIPMNKEYRDLCNKEIKNLLDRKLIRV